MVKTYPQPSKKYREVTCVAALNDQGQMRRLYPIPFRLLDGEAHFKKWQWIEARITKAPSDYRPESHKIDTDSIKRGAVIPTRGNWDERLKWIGPHLVGSFEELEARRQSTKQTLGIIRPSRVLRLEVTPERERDWNQEELDLLQRQGLFDAPEQARRPPLRKVPVAIHYVYECDGPSGTTQHRHKVTDWEAGALYWNCVRNHGESWEKPLRQMLEDDFATKDLLFVMGTMFLHPRQWLIIGLIYPPRVEKQPTLF